MPLLFVTSFLKSLYECRILCRLIECVKTSFSFFPYYTETTRTTYGTRYHVFIASSSSQQVPRSYCGTKWVTPLESSHGHHLPTRAASARAARGRCLDPKRAATAPRYRACSASPEHGVGSLLVVGQDQTQAHSSSSTRGSSTTPDDGSHIHHRPPPMPYREFLAEGRASVGLYTTASVCARSS